MAPGAMPGAISAHWAGGATCPSCPSCPSSCRPIWSPNGGWNPHSVGASQSVSRHPRRAPTPGCHADDVVMVAPSPAVGSTASAAPVGLPPRPTVGARIACLSSFYRFLSGWAWRSPTPATPWSDPGPSSQWPWIQRRQGTAAPGRCTGHRRRTARPSHPADRCPDRQTPNRSDLAARWRPDRRGRDLLLRLPGQGR